MLERFLKQLSRHQWEKDGNNSSATRDDQAGKADLGERSLEWQEDRKMASETDGMSGKRLEEPTESSLAGERSEGAITVVFANSKGGVGKSTVAFMSCLNLAIKEPDSLVEFIDLDRQATSSDSLQRFANGKFKLVSDPEFTLASGGPNNARIYQYLQSDFGYSAKKERRFVFFDTPAGTAPAEYSFMLDANYLLVPTSASDADLLATKKFLSRLFDPNPQINNEGSTGGLPTVVVIPNLLDDRSEILRIYRTLREFPCFLGHPIFYSKIFRNTFSYGISDHNVVELLNATADFGGWVVKIINDDELATVQPRTLRQI